MARSESKSSSSQDNRDMLSSLPDPVLHHIMSFMPAMQAVQLCVLSKRWKTLWTTLPVLNFDFCELGNNQLNHSTLKRVERFVEFVTMVLLLRETTSQLHTFTLDFGSEYSEYVQIGDVLRTSIRPWMWYAVKCDLRVLAINWMDDKILFLPSEVFTCRSLEYVTPRAIGTPKVINLPSLKRVHLKDTVLDQDFMNKLLCGCPVLEDLHVEDGFLEFSKITSHSLKYLKILSYGNWNLTDLSEMLINAPNLLSFHFEVCSFIYPEGLMLNMPFLREACIAFFCSDDLGYKLKFTKSNILCGLFNIHRLELKGNLSSAWWEAEIANCRTFSKLTYLSVGSCMNFHQFNLFSSLLEHCPRLKKLSLGPGFEFCGEQIDDKVARFKCEQLETVEVKFYLWDTNSHWVLKCLQEAVTELPNCRIIMTSLH